MNDTQPDYLGHRQRVRERFLKNEGQDMADYELLEFVLMMAIPRRDVKPLAKKLLQKFESFANVVSAPSHALREIDGIGDNALAMIKLLSSASKRLCWAKLSSDDTPVIMNVDGLLDYCRGTMAYSDVEELHILMLDAKLKVIDHQLMQRGTLSSVSISPREIVKQALAHNAAGIIMVHNHPSGNPRPSANDKLMTKQVDEACKLMGIRLQEHIIITHSDYFSFVEHGLITPHTA